MLLAVMLGATLLAAVAGVAWGGEAVVLGSASAANLKGLLDKVAKLAEKFAPGAGAQVQGASAMLTQDPKFAGVDWTKPASALLFGGKAFGKAEPVPVILVTLADAAAFRQAAEKEGGQVGIEIRNNVAIVSPEKAALPAVTPERFELYSKFPKVAGTADVYLTVYITQLLTEFEDELEGGLKELEQNMGQMQMPGMPNVGKVVKCVGPLVKLAGQQVRRVSLTVELKDDSVELWARLYAADDTALGTYLSAQPAETTDLVKYLPAEAVMSMAAKFDIAKAMPLMETILKSLAGPLELSAEDQQKFRDLIFGSTQTGEFAVALAGGAANPGVQTVQVLRIGDAAKYRAAAQAGVKWFMESGFGSLMQAAGMKMNMDHKPAVREHQGVAVDRLTLTFTPADPNAPPNPMMGQMPPQVTEIAAVGNLGVGVGSNPTGELLNGVLDRIKGGGTPGLDTSASWKAARAGAPKGANAIIHVSFNGLLAKIVEEAAKQQPAIAMMAGAIIKADPTEEPITSYVTFGANRMDLMTRIPHQPILALVTRVRAMVEQGAPGARKGGPKPKEQDDF